MNEHAIGHSNVLQLHLLIWQTLVSTTLEHTIEHCNGGLQNWDRFDEPWFEHAKWFPHCEFLLQQKGPEYVERVKNRFPNLSRPNLNNSINISATNNRRTSKSPTIIDPAEKHHQLCTKVETEINSSPIIQDAIQMGFSSEAIRHAFYDQFTEHNKPFTTLSALVQALLDQPETLSHAHTQDPYTALPSEKTQTPQQELHRLKQQRQCKRCCAATATVVCLPCGHSHLQRLLSSNHTLSCVYD